MSIRQEIELLVTSHNRFLKERARNMSNVNLLHNVHPLYRSDMAHRLYQAGKITLIEAQEFTKILPKHE